jgi:pimeloyl-ACP methyl ester carboxylesterase
MGARNLGGDAGYFEAPGNYTPHALRAFEQVRQYDGAMPEDPGALSAISVPVLVLHGSETGHFFAASAQHIIDNVADAGAGTIPGAGHLGPMTHPAVMADQLVRLFDRTLTSTEAR